MHRVLAQPEAQQQARERDVARHLAAQRDRLSRCCAVLITSREQRQHRRVQRVVEVRDRVVGAVDGERVLDEVVGADRQEVELAR